MIHVLAHDTELVTRNSFTYPYDAIWILDAYGGFSFELDFGWGLVIWKQTETITEILMDLMVVVRVVRVLKEIIVVSVGLYW